MAIRDLFWACPLCESEGALQPARRAEVCQVCGASFTRGQRSTIVARRTGHPDLTLSPAAWLDRLPELGIDERIRQAQRADGIIHSEAALLRTEIGDDPVSFHGTYLNRIERLGPRRAGRLQLEADRISFHADERGATQDETGTVASNSMVTWNFNAIRAVQPSSATLQINSAGLPLASLQVPGGSIRFWEELLCAALRAYYRVTDRGEIIEFQPRIVTR